MMPLPQDLTENPKAQRFGMSAPDFLSHVLAQIRLSGDHVYTEVVPAGAPVELEAAGATICVAAEGSLRLERAGTESLTVGRGDLLLLAHGAQGLGHDVRLAAAEASRVVICHFHFEAGTLIPTLPALIHLAREDGADWLEGIAFYMLAEAGNTEPGASLMISRLIDLIVIRTLRTWVQLQGVRGWLGGLADPRIARALQHIHDRPFHAWTIAALAEIAGMSRSSFCARFAERVGVPPLRYHAQWRLALARDMIRTGARRVGEVALAIGYDSEAAFSRAYRAEFGHPPVADLSRRPTA